MSCGSGPASTTTASTRAAVDDEAVTLADVAGDEEPAGRRPGDRGGSAPTARSDDEHRGGAPPGGARPRCQAHGIVTTAAAVSDGERHRVPRGVAPGDRHDGASAHRRATPAMACAGSGRHPGEPGGTPAQTTDTSATTDPGDRRRRDEGCGEQVGHHGDDRHGPLEGHDERGADRLRCEGHGEDRPQPAEAARQAREMAAPHGRASDEQPEGRHRRQGEAVGAGQPGVPDEQRDDGAGQHRHPGPAPRGRQGEQPDGAHDGGADDAGLGARHRDEGASTTSAATGVASGVAPRAARRPRRPRRPRGSRWCPTRRETWLSPVASMACGELRRGAARVADDERRHEATGIGPDVVGRRTEALPAPPRPPRGPAPATRRRARLPAAVAPPRRRHPARRDRAGATTRPRRSSAAPTTRCRGPTTSTGSAPRRRPGRRRCRRRCARRRRGSVRTVLATRPVRRTAEPPGDHPRPWPGP